jgi:hypothetical protein
MWKLARIYVFALFAVQLLVVLATSLLLQMSVWTQAMPLFPGSDDVLFAGIIYVNFLSLALAKDKNVWKNEFQRCPLSARVIILSFAAYGVAFMLWQITFGTQKGAVENVATIAALSLTLTSVTSCIPFAVLWTNAVGRPELVRRVRNSFVIAILIAATFFIHRASQPPQKTL